MFKRPTLKELALNGMMDAAKLLEEDVLDRDKLTDVSNERAKRRLEYSAIAGITINKLHGGALSLFVSDHYGGKYLEMWIGLVPELLLSPEELDLSTGDKFPYVEALEALVGGAKRWYSDGFSSIGNHGSLSFSVNYRRDGNYRSYGDVQPRITLATVSAYHAVRAALMLKGTAEVAELMKSHADQTLKLRRLDEQREEQREQVVNVYAALANAGRWLTGSKVAQH